MNNLYTRFRFWQQTGNFNFSADALRDISVECVDNIRVIKALNESRNTSNPGLPEIPDHVNLDDVLNDACVEPCGAHGKCVVGKSSRHVFYAIR